MAIQALNPSISDAQSKIINLPDRSPFMLAADLADFYQVPTKRIGEAVSRNPDRFPEDFCFELTEVETAIVRSKWSQNVTTSEASRSQNATRWANQSKDWRPLGFSEAGALALSGVLKSARAAEVSVLIHRAFAAMMQERRAIAESLTERTQFVLMTQHRLWFKIKFLADYGWSFDMIKSNLVNTPAWRLALAVNDMVRLGILKQAPAGSPDPRIYPRAAEMMKLDQPRDRAAEDDQGDLLSGLTPLEKVFTDEADA